MKSRVYTYLDDLRNDYVNIFKKTLLENSGLKTRELHEMAINSQAPQWYCTTETAIRALACIEKAENGQDVFGNPYKREKYYELHRRVLSAEQNSSLPRAEIVEEIIQGPAPSFYISYRTARWFILINRKQLRNEKNKHSFGWAKP